MSFPNPQENNLGSSDVTSHKPSVPDQRVIEIVAGLVLAAVSLTLLFWLIPGYVGHSDSEHDVSPDFFPTAAAWMLLGLSAVLVAMRFIKATESVRSTNNKTGGIVIVVQLVVWLIVAAIAYAGIVYVSFHLTAFALIVLGGLVCHYRKWSVLATVAIVAPIFIAQISWLVFSVKWSP